MTRSRRWAALASWPMLALALGADGPGPKGYVCGRTPVPLVIDGKLDEPAWNDAAWTDDFVDIEGDAKPRPRFRTRARMLWDETYLYIAAELAEPHVWGTLKDHDAVIFADNDFEVFIDPDGDNHSYYELEINALNTEWDLLLEKPYRDGGPALNSWEIPGLRKGVQVQGTLNDPSDRDESWTVELALPWAALKPLANCPTPPRDGDQWRINFSRVEWEHTVEDGRYKKVPMRPEANWVWSPQGAVDMHRPERWGYVQFSTRTHAELPAFRPDSTQPARDRLMAIYRAQKTHHDRTKAWAPTLEALGLPATTPGQPAALIEASPDGYEARITLGRREAGNGKTLTIRQDSRLTLTED